MKNSDKAYVQAYNTQAAVDSQAQIIIGCDLTNQAADAPHLLPMVEQVQQVTGRLPDQWSSDAGYFSEDNKATYSRRKETAEPVFGQIKQGRGLRRFLLRGLSKVKAEWTLWCLTHNLLKIARALVAKPALRQQLKAA